MEHRDIPALHMHRPHNWVVADQAARDALAVGAADVGKYAWVEDTSTEWVLLSAEPITWKERVGDKGPKGDPGEQGLQGPKGDKGDAADALAAVLTGLVTSDASDVLTTDNILQAIGKLQAQASGKVDKVAGKVLSSNDFTNDERVKLANIAEQATKNATDAALRDRSTHTGTQPITSISGLEAQTSAGVAAAIAMAQTFTSVPSTFQAWVIFVTEPHFRTFAWDGVRYVRAPWHRPGVLFFSHAPVANVTHGIQVRADVTYNKTDHPDLAEILGVSGSTFVLTEGRARVLRAADNGRGIDSVLVNGYLQEDAIQSHTHGLGGTPIITGVGTAYSGGTYGDVGSPITDAGYSGKFAGETRVKSLAATLYITR